MAGTDSISPKRRKNDIGKKTEILFHWRLNQGLIKYLRVVEFEKRIEARNRGESPGIHCGAKPGHFEMSNHSLSHKQRSAQAKRAVRSERTSERCERMSERMSEWPSTYVSILACFRPQCSG